MPELKKVTRGFKCFKDKMAVLYLIYCYTSQLKYAYLSQENVSRVMRQNSITL